MCTCVYVRRNPPPPFRCVIRVATCVVFASLRLSKPARNTRVCSYTSDIGVDFSRLIRRHGVISVSRVTRAAPPKCVIRFSAISSFHPRREPLRSRFNGALIVSRETINVTISYAVVHELIDEHALAYLYVRTKRGGEFSQRKIKIIKKFFDDAYAIYKVSRECVCVCVGNRRNTQYN